MIGSVAGEIGDTTVRFKLSAAVMMAIEDTHKIGIADYLADLENDFQIGKLAEILGLCFDDGACKDRGVGAEVIDALGVDGAAELFAQITESAFPEAKNTEGADSAKNGTGADQTA